MRGHEFLELRVTGVWVVKDSTSQWQWKEKRSYVKKTASTGPSVVGKVSIKKRKSKFMIYLAATGATNSHFTSLALNDDAPKGRQVYSHYTCAHMPVWCKIFVLCMCMSIHHFKNSCKLGWFKIQVPVCLLAALLYRILQTGLILFEWHQARISVPAAFTSTEERQAVVNKKLLQQRFIISKPVISDKESAL